MTDERDYKKRYKSLALSLQRAVECPVCLETLKVPFKICSRGHGVCLDCLSNLANCPSCEGLFVLENIVCLNNMLEVLPKLCCYTDDGCEEVVEPGNEHEMFCGYRPIACVHGCTKKMPINQFKAHFEEHHSELLQLTRESETFEGDFWDDDKVYRIPVFLFDNLFWIVEKANTQTEQLNIFFGKTPINRLEHDYYVQIKFEQGEFRYIHTMKALLINDVIEFNENKCYTADETRCAMGKYCMSIPLCELLRFKSADGLVTCKYSFFKI